MASLLFFIILMFIAMLTPIVGVLMFTLNIDLLSSVIAAPILIALVTADLLSR